MMNWAKKSLGLKDEIYGPEAVRSVALQTAETPYTVTTREDHKWQNLEETNVETKTFYVFAPDGHVAMFQVVCSSLLGMRKTGTVNTKLFSPDTRKVLHWDTDELKTWSFSEDKTDFHGDYSSAELSEDGTAYTLKIKNEKVTAELVFTRTAPGIKLGKNGTTTYGTDHEKPWGKMTHNFWPRTKVTGSMTPGKGQMEGKTVNLDGVGMYAYALQGMKPHFAASKWNFFSFAGPTHSAILMEFTTPASYADTVVSVGIVATDSDIIISGASPNTHAEHVKSKLDKNKLPEPTDVAFTIAGTPAGASASVSTPVGASMDVIDIMGELPALVRQLAISASGTKPYIFQYGPDVTLNLKTASGEDVQEAGRAFIEATFITKV